MLYPSSTWRCSNTSNTDEDAREYCILTNIYYNSLVDQYYFYQNSSTTPRSVFKAPYDDLVLNVIQNVTSLQARVSSILLRPILVAAPPDLNYMHGLVELCGPRFWALAECQSHASYINPDKVQIYYTSTMFNTHEQNWERYERQPDHTYRPTRQWEQAVHSMFSVYPLLVHRSFNGTTVLFKYMIFPGRQFSRTATWGYSNLELKFRSSPMPTAHYRRAYLAYSEWILYHLSLPSKFQLTPSQADLQEKVTTRVDEYTGEWIVVLNRNDTYRRSLLNAKQLVKALLKAVPDQSNPYLRVWPQVFNFNDDFYASVRMARSIRLLIGVHGAGLANALFMRPGAAVLEINPYGCRHLSFYYRRWTEVFNLQYALWIPSVGERGEHDEPCQRDNPVAVNIGEIIDEAKNLLANEAEYRTGYLQRALDVMNDVSLVDHPPLGYEAVFS